MKLLFALILLSSAAVAQRIQWQPVATQLPAPIGMAATVALPGQLFVVCQPGYVYRVETGKEPFLVADLSNQVVEPRPGYDERGLLGMAFHPNFAQNRKVYLHYSRPGKAPGRDHITAIVVTTLDASGKLSAMQNDILTVDQPESNHNGGDLAFGPDGYLYISLGDGGGQGDKHGTVGNSQDPGSLLGKILRINVDKAGDGKAYTIPVDNPFANTPAFRPEIWALGFRNPWRISFDTKTGQLFTGDVGQDQYEEVDLVVKGGNYGWRLMEANHCFNPKENCKPAGVELKAPIDEYPHSIGVSVTGGYVYRGKAMPQLQGKYVFGDWLNKLFLLAPNGDKWERQELLADQKPNLVQLRVNGFGQDSDGEVYLCAQDETGPKNKTGYLYKLVPTP